MAEAELLAVLVLTAWIVGAALIGWRDRLTLEVATAVVRLRLQSADPLHRVRLPRGRKTRRLYLNLEFGTPGLKIARKVPLRTPLTVKHRLALPILRTALIVLYLNDLLRHS